MVRVRPLISNLDWNLLRTFLVIVEEKSITRAAERLSIKQPSVSAALHRLEENLGCVLIVRGSRRFELTKHGEVLFNECTQIYRAVARISEKLAGAEKDITGSVRILTVTAVQYEPFDTALRELHARFPSITLDIEVASSQEGVRAVARQIAPFALCLLTKPVAGLTCRHLVREEFGIFCGLAHPLYGRSDVELTTLRDQDFIGFTCAVDGGVLEPMLALGTGSGLGSRLVGTSTDLNEVLRMISAGVGIGILPVASVRREKRLWRFLPSGVSLGADLYLVTNPAMILELAEAEFLSVFSEYITDDQPGPSRRVAKR
jgi:DNA-binding transcriptional LysR family regulator